MANEKSPAMTSAPSSTSESEVTQTPTPTPTETPVVTPKPTETPMVTPEPTLAPEDQAAFGRGQTSNIQSLNEKESPVSNQTNQQATPTTLETMIEAIKRSDNQPGKFAVVGIERYIDNMTPGMPISKSDLIQQQVGLWKTLQNMVENTEEDFNKVYSVVLGLFLKHKNGVFHEHYVFRMMAEVTMDKNEIQAFLSFVNLIRVTADPVGRQAALKQNVDISRTLANVFSENARQKILAFYGM